MQDIRTEIDTYLTRTGGAPSTFSRLVVGNPNWVNNLRNGGSCNERNAQKARKFMAEHPDQMPTLTSKGAAPAEAQQ